MSTPFREIARGIGFTEGPVWLGAGEVAVTSMSRGMVAVLDLQAGSAADPLRWIETGGGPNGLARDASGRLAVMQNATFRTRSERPVTAGLQFIDGAAVRDVDVPESVAPNDGAYGPDGALWYTDPGTDPERELGPRIRRWDPVTGEVTTVAEQVPFPNGLAFTADGGRLLVADSHGHSLLAFDVDGVTLGEPELFCDLPGTEPDGIALDVHGNVYVAAFGSDEVVVVDPAGGVTERIPTGEGSRPTNLCFAGPDLATLVVTLASGGRVVALDDRFEGLPL